MQSLQEGFEKQGQPVNFGTMAHDHEMYLNLADTAMELRDEVAIKKYAPMLEELAMRDNHKLYLAIAHRAQGVGLHLAGKNAEAEMRLHQALEIFTELGCRWQMGRTLFELAQLSAKKKAKAREYFLQALSAFEEIQAVHYAEQARSALSSLG
jgi:tetratricopeptide (TPR) repeat protein